ncbi:barstar family protein [Testudinibacter sp. TR-2022]|uniref:barstar family protein n=1 Tax=Testudinibacter sp. TR-2022 TaxID=2585029 RepID=UPI0022774068|nr:barstar family protein [Testudinibacter sp. TR-2022]
MILNGNNILSESDFYDELKKIHPDFGYYFGRNLNALRDYVGLLDGYTIRWVNYKYSKEKLKDNFEVIINIFHEYNENILNNGLNKDGMIKLVLC